MFTNLLLLASLLTSPAAAAAPGVPPVLTVKAARAAGPGATVTVRAVVLNGPELGNLRFVQDAEAGLALYALSSKVPGFGELQSGDSILVTGTLKNYNGLLEMDPVQAVSKLAAGRQLRTLRAPVTQAAALMTEANEGRLLELTGITRMTAPNGLEVNRLASSTSYLLNGQPGALVRIANGSTGPGGLVGLALPGGETYEVRGILSQYAPGGTGGYQLQPRLATDIVRGGLPRLTAEPVPGEVKPTGFTVVFTTLNPGDTRVRYGLSANALTESRLDPALTTQHSLTLDDLTPDTTYYVEVGSRNAAGTETAPPVAFSTAAGKKDPDGKTQ